MAINPEDEINRLNKALQETLTLLAELKRVSIASRGGVISDAEVKALQQYNTLLAERARLSGAAKKVDPLSGGTPANPKINFAGVSSQAKKDAEDLAAALGKVNEKIANPLKNMTAEQQKLAASRNATNNAKYVQQLQQEVKQLERNAQRTDALRREEKRLADARTKLTSDPRYREALQQAQARGFSSESLQSIEDRGGGIQRLKFSQTVGGINQQFNPYVNMLTGKSNPGLSSQFRTFGSDIARDIGQFTKWSIAIAAVYTPMQKLGELMAIMVDNESRLADATIAANVPFEKSGEIFDSVAISANAAGESINTTIDAYTSAIRAAGRYGTEAEKTAQATALLNDSLILSKISALDQSDAIDTLSAALLQSDRDLNQGQELLNKWVRVSQIANVGIDALATGVAVLGDSAETSGLSIDQLIGLIAVLSANSISGSKEAANTAKALVGAYQSDKAEAALNKYGIALRKTNGEVRDFLDIYMELSRLRKEGVLSEPAVSEVATALGGGGVRRMKDASALINSTDELNRIAKESAAITGDDTLAQDALAKKLETVQTANTRLANSFQELAQTLGDDGGLLDYMKTLVNLLTDSVRGMNELFTILGRSGPILATVTAGLVGMQAYYNVGGRRETALEALGAKANVIGFAGGERQYGSLTQGYGGGPLADILRMNYRGAGIIGGAGVALQGISNIAAGKNENAVANVVGGAIGGAVGAALGGPIGLAAGANIGSAAGDAMVNSLKTHKGDFESIFAPPTPRGGDFEALKAFFSNQNVGNTELPKNLAGLSDEEIKRLLFTAVGGGNEMAGTLKSRNFAYFQGQQYTEGAAALELLKQNNPAAAQLFELEKARRDAEAERRKQMEAQVTSGTYTGLQNRAAEARQYQLGQLAQGNITTADYGRISEQLGGFPAVSIKSVNALGYAVNGVTKDVQKATETYDKFLYIAEYGTQEQINQLSSYSDDWYTLSDFFRRMQGGENVIGMKMELSFGEVTITSAKQLQELMAQSSKSLGTSLDATYGLVQKQQGQKITLPPLVGDYNEPTPLEEYNKAVERGKDIQLKFYQSVGKTDKEIQSLIAGIETFYTTVDTGSESIFKATSGLEQRFYELGKAAEEAAGGFGLQKFDVDRATLEKLAAQSLLLSSAWQKQTQNDNLPGFFKSQPEDLLAITNDSVAKPIHADFRILALLLEKIVDQNQKQLDGQYNIPEGATFWVPLTAAYYRNKGTSGGSDLQSMIDSLSLDTNTSATDNNTRALEQLSSVMSNADRLKLEYQDQSTQKPDLHKLNADRLRNLEYPQDMHERNADRLRNLEYPRVPGPIQQTTSRSLSSASQPITPTTKLDMKISSNINLMVDGRILAQTLQSYMTSELLRTEQTQGTITKRYVY